MIVCWCHMCLITFSTEKAHSADTNQTQSWSHTGQDRTGKGLSDTAAGHQLGLSTYMWTTMKTPPQKKQRWGKITLLPHIHLLTVDPPQLSQTPHTAASHTKAWGQVHLRMNCLNLVETTVTKQQLWRLWHWIITKRKSLTCNFSRLSVMCLLPLTKKARLNIYGLCESQRLRNDVTEELTILSVSILMPKTYSNKYDVNPNASKCEVSLYTRSVRTYITVGNILQHSSRK